MNMSESEILASYNQAKNPKKQIGVLADLNGCSRAAMRAKLQELGARVPSEPAEKKNMPRPPKFDVVRAMELHREGLGDLDISERLGISPRAVAGWRRSQNLPANRAKPVRHAQRKPPEASVADGPMTASRVAEVFAQIAKWHPDAPVSMDGKRLAAIMLSSCFDSRKDAEVEVYLMEG